MANVFSRRADRIARALIVLAGLVAVVVVLRLVGVIPPGALAGSAEPPPQPRPFSHFHHVAEIGVACGYCHTGARTGPEAGYPPVETCGGCHLSVPELTAVLPPPLPWARVAAVPGFVYFDHRPHVAHGIDCAACHGDMGLAHETRQPIAFTMAFCLDCHRATAEAAGIDPYRLTNCHVCHR